MSDDRQCLIWAIMPFRCMASTDLAECSAWPEVVEGRRVGLTLYAEAWQSLLAEDENAAYNLAAIMIDQCIGEASAIVHVDWLDLLTEPSEEEGLPLSRLREFIRELDDEQEDIDPCEYFTTYEMEPADLEGDWDLREDVIVGNTAWR